MSARKLVVRFAIRETVGVATTAAALLGAAGDLRWLPGWGIVVLTAAWTLATGIVITRTHPDLLAERLGPKKGSKPRDLALMSAYGLVQLAMLVVAGLDHRFGWTGTWPVVATAAALAVVGLGHATVVWATAVNAFFSQIVRVQTERGHHVVRDGPYRFVRHPAYTGTIAVGLASPLALGSWAAAGVGLLGATLIVARTALEDATLHAELPGYPDYADEVRARLVPRVW